MKIKKIVSGGQTGSDRAALDVAIEIGCHYGGWVPLGRLAEDGIISSLYFLLKECDSKEPSVRTELNVRDSDATLILSNGELIGGSAYTRKMAVKLGKPFLHVDFEKLRINEAIDMITEWLNAISGNVLNVAGPRQSENPQIYSQVKELLFKVLLTNRRI